MAPKLTKIFSELEDSKKLQKEMVKEFLKQRPGDTRFDSKLSVCFSVKNSPKLLILEDFESRVFFFCLT